jgi:hypothetical protein
MADALPLNCPEPGCGFPLHHLGPIGLTDSYQGTDLPTEMTERRYECPRCQAFYELTEHGRLIKLRA